MAEKNIHRCPCCDTGLMEQITPIESGGLFCCNNEKCEYKERALETILHVPRLAEYWWQIARKMEHHNKIPDFLEHFLKHIDKIWKTINAGNLPEKKDTIALKNFMGITEIMRRDGLGNIKDCVEALVLHHHATKNWSVGEDGSIKEAEDAGTTEDTSEE